MSEEVEREAEEMAADHCPEGIYDRVNVREVSKNAYLKGHASAKKDLGKQLLQARDDSMILGYYYAKCTSGSLEMALAVFKQLENFGLAVKAARIAIEEQENQTK